MWSACFLTRVNGAGTLLEDVAMDETALADIGFSDDHEFEIVSFFADFSVILFVHAFNFIMGKKK